MAEFSNGEELIVRTRDFWHAPETPVLEGKVFSGWYAEKECTTLVSSSSNIYDLENAGEVGKTYYAGWSDSYKLTFVFGEDDSDYPGGKTGYYYEGNRKERVLNYEIPVGMAIRSDYYPTDGGSPSFYSNTDTRYIFTNWYTDENRSEEKKIEQIEGYVPTEDTTFYAGYKVKSGYVIKCHIGNNDAAYFVEDPEGIVGFGYGEGDVITFVSPNKYFHGDQLNSYIINNNPNKKLIGWYSDPEYKNLVCNVGEYNYSVGDETQDVDIYARWEDDKSVVTATFDLDLDENPTAYYSDEPKGQESKTVRVPEPKSGSLNLGNIGTDARYVLYGFSTDKKAETPDDGFEVQHDYSHDDDSIDVSSSKTEVFYGTKFIVDEELSESTIYHAVWKKEYYLIAFKSTEDGYFHTNHNTNGGDYYDTDTIYYLSAGKGIEGFSSNSYANGERPIPYDAHKMFKGYYTKDGTSVSDYNSFNPITEDMTFYAQYKDAYILTYDANGGWFSDSDAPGGYSRTRVEKRDVSGTQSGLGAEPDHDDDKIFAGWYLDRACTVPADRFGFKLTEDTTVYAKWVDYTVPTKVTITTPSQTIYAGQTLQLEASVEPASASDQEVEWFIWATYTKDKTKKAALTITEDGLVTGVCEGYSMIHAQVNGKYSSNVTIYVKEDNAKDSLSINYSNSSKRMLKGDSVTVTADVTPFKAASQVTWTSQDPGIASVVGDGTSATITANKAGTTKIVASYKKLKAYVNVTVYANAAFIENTMNLSAREGTTGYLDLQMYDSSLSGKTVTWTYSKPEVLTVTPKEGNTWSADLIVNTDTPIDDIETVTIRASVDGTSYYDECVVTITPDTSLSVDTNSVYMPKNDTATVTAKVVPASFKGTYKWTTSNAKVAKVVGNENTATITSLGIEGTANITVSFGNMKQVIAVTVQEPLVLDQNTIGVNYKDGNTKTLSAIVSDRYAENDLKWTSSDPGLLAVSTSEDTRSAVLSVITTAPIYENTVVTVTATIDGTDYYKTCEVTVRPIEVVKAPVAYLESGAAVADGATVTVKNGKTIALKSATYGARIFYTTAVDGASPADPKITVGKDGEVILDDGVEEYVSSFAVTGQTKETTIKAIAYEGSLITSGVYTFKYKLEKADWGDIDNQNEDLKDFIQGHFPDSSAIENKVWYVFKTGDGYECRDGAASAVATGITKKYNGNKITFNDEIFVFHGTRRLIENRDFTITYANNVNAMAADANSKKLPTFTIKGKGTYNSNTAFTFSIEAENINSAVITSEKAVPVAENSVLGNTKPVVTYNGKKLALNTDYTLSYYKATEGGDVLVETPNKEKVSPAVQSYKIVVAAKEANFTGTMDATVTVLPIAKATSKKTVQVSKLSVVNEKGKAISVPYDETLDIDTIRTWFVNGSAVVKNGKTVLAYGTDYTVEAVSGEDYTRAGTHKFIVKGVDKSAVISADDTAIWYAGEKTVSFTVEGTNLAKAKIAGLKTTVEYTGNAITLEDLFNASDKNLREGWNGVTLYTVTGSGKNAVYTALEENTDYTVSMNNTGVVGKFDLVFTGTNGCTGTIKKTITVKAHAINTGVTASVDVTPTYVKSGAKPKVTVKYGETVLAEGIDYTVSYKNNAKVFTGDLTDPKLAKSAPTAVIKGIGNYSGTGLNAAFNINPASVKQISVVVNDVNYNERQSGKSGYFLVAPKLLDDGKAVTTGKNKDLDAIAKTDYSYTYHVDTVLGDGTTRAAGDTVKATDKVMPGTIIAVSVPVSVSFANSPYTNTVAGVADTLVGYYKVIGAANNISKYTVKISDAGKNKLFVNNGDPVVLTKDDFEVYVKTGKNPELLSAENYEIVSITGNKSVGTATVTLSGKGAYGGTKNVTFKISAKSVR